MIADSFSPWTVETPGAHAVNRAALILRILAVSGGHGASISEVADLSNLPKSTVHRLLAALVDERLAERTRQTRRYRLGMEILALGAASGPKHDLQSIARPSLERISRDSGHVTHLMIRSGYDAVCLDQVVTGGRPSMIGRRGSRAPLGVGVNSLTFLSALNDDEIKDVMSRNERRLEGHPVFNVERIMREIMAVRRQGYGVWSIERNPRIFGVGVPILTGARRPLAAIGITTVNGMPLAADEVRLLVARLKEESARISQDYEAIHDDLEEEWLRAGTAEQSSDESLDHQAIEPPANP